MKYCTILLLLMLSFLTACNSGDTEPKYLTKEEAMLRGMLMFKDSEDIPTLYSDDRKFKWGEMLGADILSTKDGFLKWYIRNFIPQDIDNVSVLLSANTLSHDILITKFETVPMHYLLLSYLPFDNTSIFKSDVGDDIHITDEILKDKTLKLIIRSDNNTFMLSRTIMKTTPFSFFLSGDYQNITMNVTPALARYYTMLLINFGYMIFSDELDYQLNQLPAIGCELKDNGKVVTRENFLINIRRLNQGGVKLGVLDQKKAGLIAGFASPSQLNLRNDYMGKILEDNYESLIWAITHEWGHVLGYGHEGNMTYEKGNCGFTPLMKRTYNALRARGELPIMVAPF